MTKGTKRGTQGARKVTTPRATLTPRDVAKMRAESMCKEDTIRKWAKGEPVRAKTQLDCERAARKLGLPFNGAVAT